MLIVDWLYDESGVRNTDCRSGIWREARLRVSYTRQHVHRDRDAVRVREAHSAVVVAEM